MRRPTVDVHKVEMIIPRFQKAPIAITPLTKFSDKARQELGCLRCTDSPCSRLGREEQNVPSIPDQASVLASPEVCPVKAIVVSESGEPKIDQAKCVGCGLCVARCPTGALTLTGDPEKPTALQTLSEFKRVGEAEGFAFRNALKASYRLSRPSVPDMARQVMRFRMGLRQTEMDWGLSVNSVTRVLVRNAFISMGAKVALRNQGANSLLTELIVEEGERLYLVEISTTDDTLDAFRRVLSASARAIGRSAKSVEQVTGMLIVPSLPNRRVDLYRLVEDAERYLGIRFLVVPIAAISFAILQEAKGVEKTFSNFRVGEGNESVEEAVRNQFGSFTNMTLGFRASK